mmetsp:Transcript_18183/g.23242  ORF Transcript_18183/g.23242 Transcript_18183/m.23242 type:complete len:269 (+) Transcript_18183:30-836(+)
MHPVVINDPEDGIAGGAPDPAAPLLVDEPEQPEQPAAADDDADGDDAANNADEDNDDEVGRVVLPVDDRRARSHWPMEGNVTQPFYGPFVEVILEAMLSVYRPHIERGTENVRVWRELTDWAFSPNGPLRTFKRWGSAQTANRAYLKLRKSIMHAVSYFAEQHDNLGAFGLGGAFAEPTQVQMMARQIMDEVEQMDAEDEIRQQEEDERQQDMDDAEDEMALAPLQGEGAMNHGAGLGIIRNNNVGRGKFICLMYSIPWRNSLFCKYS